MRSRNVSPGFAVTCTRIQSDKHPRAASHRGSVAARLADDGRGLAGDGALVHRRDAFDDLAVGRDHLAGRHADDVAFAQRGRRHGLAAAVLTLTLRHRLRLRFAQRVRLCLAAPFGHRLGEVRKQHRQPQPERDLELESQSGWRGQRILNEPPRRQDAADLHDEHHRVPRHRARMQLSERVPDRPADDLRIPDGERLCRSDCRHQKTCPLFIRKCSTIGPRLSAGKNVSAPTITITPTSKRREERRRHRECAERWRNQLLAAKAAGDGQRRNDHEEAAEQHRQAERRVVPLRVDADAAERRAVVRRRRRVRVEHLGQAVRARVEDARRPEVRRDRRHRR